GVVRKYMPTNIGAHPQRVKYSFINHVSMYFEPFSSLGPVNPAVPTSEGAYAPQTQAWAACWPFDRTGSNPTPSRASLRLPVTTPTMLRGTQSSDTAVYESLTSCHSAKSHEVSKSV